MNNTHKAIMYCILGFIALGACHSILNAIVSVPPAQRWPADDEYIRYFVGYMHQFPVYTMETTSEAHTLNNAEGTYSSYLFHGVAVQSNAYPDEYSYCRVSYINEEELAAVEFYITADFKPDAFYSGLGMSNENGAHTEYLIESTTASDMPRTLYYAEYRLDKYSSALLSVKDHQYNGALTSYHYEAYGKSGVFGTAQDQIKVSYNIYDDSGNVVYGVTAHT